MVTFRRAIPLALILALVGFATACDDDATGPRVPSDVSFAPELGVNLDDMTELESGVYIQTLAGGEGLSLVQGDRVTLDYTLWLANGTQVDSGTEVQFTISAGSVIDGFRLGLIGMLPGEERLLVIPSALGYGAGGTQGIPPHSVLVFRVTHRGYPGPI